ncbi:MAG: radical SAM protein [Bacteroidota bacterium]|nr:radical SAM protein [Bacteroidota bacterium]
MRLTKKPILCNYYLTYRCNASCSFCDIWERPSPYVTIGNVTQNLRDLKKLGVKVIDFTGGEPLLHRQLPQFLELAKKMGFITTVTTNTLLYPKYAEKLKGKIDMLHFSLDSPDADEHNESRGVNCFDHLIRSIEIAKKLGERPDILYTVHKGNADKIGAVYEDICKPNGLILILNPIFSYNEVGSDLSSDSLKAIRAWGRKPNIYINNAFLTLREDGGNQVAKPVCKAASTTIVISPENKMIMPCYHLEKEAMPIEDNLYDLRKTPEVQALISLEGKYKECQGCTVNCYFQPSFAVEVNKYFFQALPSTLKYAWAKGTWKQLI